MNALFLSKDDGLGVEVLGGRYVFKLRARDTDGALCQFEGVVPPGHGTPPHRVHGQDKSFLVLEGTFGFRLGEELFTASAGDFVFVPRGTLHQFTNTGPAEARLLVTFTPAGHHEEMFAELSTLPPGPLDAARLAEINARYGVEVG